MRTSLRLLLTAVALGSAVIARGREIPPPPETFVLDEPDWLQEGEEHWLSRKLADFERATSHQIVVAIFRSLGDEDLADYSLRVAQTWRIGRAGLDNGILLAVYAEERLIDIEVGYGLEGAVTDAVAAEIIDRQLRPAFRVERYADGLSLAIADLMAATRGAYVAGDGFEDLNERNPLWVLVPFGVIFGLLAVLIGRHGQRRYYGNHSIGHSWHGSGWGGGGLGGGGFGAGGGFSGGGGSFGGGGARGGW